MTRGVALLLGAAALVALAAPAQAAPRDAIRDREYWLDDYGIRDAWSVTRGSGVTIAIIDTGVAGGIAELSGAVVGTGAARPRDRKSTRLNSSHS